MNAIEQALTTGWTTGAVGVWGLLITVLGIWWKGLPAVIEKLDQRRAGIEERARDFLEEERKRFKEMMDDERARFKQLELEQAERFAAKLAMSEHNHEECMQGQRVLREEVAALRKENGELLGLLRGMQQGQIATQKVVARTIQEAKDDCPS